MRVEQGESAIGVDREQCGRHMVAFEPRVQPGTARAVGDVDDHRLLVARLVFACPQPQRLGEHGVYLFLRAGPRLPEVEIDLGERQRPAEVFRRAHVAHVEHEHAARSRMHGTDPAQQLDATGLREPVRRDHDRNELARFAERDETRLRVGCTARHDDVVVGAISPPEHSFECREHRVVGGDRENDRHHAGARSATARMRSSVCSIPVCRSVRRSLRAKSTPMMNQPTGDSWLVTS